MRALGATELLADVPRTTSQMTLAVHTRTARRMLSRLVHDGDAHRSDGGRPAGDPVLPGAVPGSGVDHYSFRYGKGSGPLTAWQDTTANAFDAGGFVAGDVLTVELVAYDRVGNASSIMSASLAVTSEPEDDDPGDDTGEDDPIDDADLSGAMLDPFGVGANMGDESGSSASSVFSGAAAPVIEPCPDRGRGVQTPGERSYMWMHFRRKAVTETDVANGRTKYSLHMQARAAWIPMAASARLNVWRKLNPGQSKRQLAVKQTDPRVRRRSTTPTCNLA